MATAGKSVRTLLRDGVQALLLATADGFVIDAANHHPSSIDFESLAAEMAGIFRAANLIGHDLAESPVRTMTITLDNGQAVLAVPIAGEAIGVLIPQRRTTYGDALKALDQIRPSMHHILELHTGTKLVEAMSRADEVGPAAAGGQPLAGIRPGRIALTEVQVDAVGDVATVRVTLRFDHREVTAKTVGRDLPGQRAILAGQATIRAMLDLLPAGHALEVTHLQATTPSREALWALTRFLSPDSEQSLFGIAPVQEGDEAVSAAKAILNAVNRRVEVLLAPPTP